MKSEKVYIGKGTQVKDFDIVNLTISMEEAEKLTFESKQGNTLLNFTVARLREPDAYGKTHTVYVSVLEKTPTPMKPIEQPKKKTAKAKESSAQKKLTFANH